MKKIALLSCLFVLGLFSTANATLITYEFSGYLTRIYENDYSADTFTGVEQTTFLGERYDVGDSFTGHFTYDTESTESTSTFDDESWGFYYGAIKQSEVKINNSTLSIDDVNGSSYISVRNDAPYTPPKDILSTDSTLRLEDTVYKSQLEFTDSSASIFNDISIPSIIELTTFDEGKYARTNYRQWIYDRASKDSISLYGAFESLTPSAPVPEPSTILLLGIGLLGVARVSRKKK